MRVFPGVKFLPKPKWKTDQWFSYSDVPFTGVSMLFSDVWAVTRPKSPTFTDPSIEKKILDGCHTKKVTIES